MKTDHPAKGYSRQKEAFLFRTARSVSEIQSNVNNLADVLVFLEVLGYNAKTAREHGFRDMRELARQVFEVIDYFGPRTEAASQQLRYRTPTLSRRLLEGLALSAPWLMMLPLLFVFGVSLWMDWHLPAAPLTALGLGLLLGMMVSEGHVWTYSRLLLFYRAQTNVGETRRVIKRSYLLFAVMLTATGCALVGAAVLVGVPLGLVAIAVASIVTMSFHRFSFTVVYAQRKIVLSVVAYAAAFTALLSVYFLTSTQIPDPTTRYLAALGAGFLVLSVVAIYCTWKMYTAGPAKATADAPHFYKPLFINKETLRSRFGIQLWENAPYYLYGTFFIVMLFGDRLISWFYNTDRLVGGSVLPLVFNAAYHRGADIALLVVFPIGLVQYVRDGHIFSSIHNISLESPSTDPSALDRYVRRRYLLTMSTSLAISGSIAAGLIFFAPAVMVLLNGTSVSMEILRVAALGNFLLAIFVVNSSYVMLLNKAKVLAAIAALCALIVGVGGGILGQFGFEDIVFAYFCSCATAACLSTFEIRRLMRRPASLFFARYS